MFKFNVTEGSISSDNPVPMDVFLSLLIRGVSETTWLYFFMDKELLYIDLKLGTQTK